MSKDCCHRKDECCHCEDGHRQLLRRILVGIAAFIILILNVIFLIWFILRPTKPRFILQDVTVYSFNISSTGTAPSPTYPLPNTLSVAMQVTLSARNPNERIGIYYQKLDVYVSYRSQRISMGTELHPTYQGHKDVTVCSPFLYGNVPVSPYVLNCLQQDLNAGAVLLNVKVNGRLKWKVGTWVSGRYHIHVNCPAVIRLAGDGDKGIGVCCPVVKFQLLQSCSVDV